MKDILIGDYVMLDTGMMFKVVTCNRFIDVIVVAGVNNDFEIKYMDVEEVYRLVK